MCGQPRSAVLHPLKCNVENLKAHNHFLKWRGKEFVVEVNTTLEDFVADLNLGNIKLIFGSSPAKQKPVDMKDRRGSEDEMK